MLLCLPNRNNKVAGIVDAAGDEDKAQQQGQLPDSLTLPDDYVDDVYHCDDPLDIENNIVSCDPVSFQWNVTELLSSLPPGQCDQNVLLAAAISTQGFQDRDEPCVLWYMLYGVFPDDTVPSPFYDNEGTLYCFSLLGQLDYRVYAITLNSFQT